jgi:hypothetical protein
MTGNSILLTILSIETISLDLSMRESIARIENAGPNVMSGRALSNAVA